jgi:hypothetical protein
MNCSPPPSTVMFLMVTLAALFVVLDHNVVPSLVLLAFRRKHQMTVFHHNVSASFLAALHLILADQHGHAQQRKQKQSGFVHFEVVGLLGEKRRKTQTQLANEDG